LVHTAAKPTDDDRDAWKAYWMATGSPWRTEPEAHELWQTHLSTRLSIPPDIEAMQYPLKDIHLDRGAVEWLIATHNADDSLDFRGAVLQQGVDLSNLPLSGARFGLSKTERRTHAHLTPEQCAAAGADLTEANLSNSNLNGASFYSARMRSVILEGADLREADLSMADLQPLEYTRRPSDLHGANLHGAWLLDTQLQRTNFARAILGNACLDRAHLEYAHLGLADLNGASLQGAHLQNTILLQANLEAAYMVGAELEHAKLQEARLINTILERASLKCADLGRADLSGASLVNANLSGASLREATFDHRTRFGGATISDHFRKGFRSTDGWNVDGPIRIADSTLGRANISMLAWHELAMTGDEAEARKLDMESRVRYGRELTLYHVWLDRAQDDAQRGQLTEGWNNFKRSTRLEVATKYETAIRATRQLSNALVQQGLNEEASYFSYRAKVLERGNLFRRRKILPWLYSMLIFVVCGYGYKVVNAILTFTLFNLAFAFLYTLPIYRVDAINGPARIASISRRLRFDQALVESVHSFGGRGLALDLSSVGDWFGRISAAEAIMALIIELILVATFTQRLFAK
jgi:uncharacterized protein YjbI with pentapeptide repeats